MAARFGVAGVDGEADASVNAIAAVRCGAASLAFAAGVASETFCVLAARGDFAIGFGAFPADLAPAALAGAAVGVAASVDDAFGRGALLRPVTGFAAGDLAVIFFAETGFFGESFAGAAAAFPAEAFGARAGFDAADVAAAVLRGAGFEEAEAGFFGVKSSDLALPAGAAAFAGAFALGALPSSATSFLGLFGGIPGRPLGAGCRWLNCAKIWRAKLGPVQGESCQNYGPIFS